MAEKSKSDQRKETYAAAREKRLEEQLNDLDRLIQEIRQSIRKNKHESIPTASVHTPQK